MVGHYRTSIKAFAHIAQTLHKHLLGEGACKKNKWVKLKAEAKDKFETLKEACLEVPVLAFADWQAISSRNQCK